MSHYNNPFVTFQGLYLLKKVIILNLHIGQLLFILNQVMIHSLWKKCLHGNYLTNLFLHSYKQIQQSSDFFNSN